MKHKLISTLFCLILCAGFALQVFLPDQALSKTERRKLAQFPALNLSSVVSAKWMKDFEAYLLDQFPMRDAFLSLKAFAQFFVFFQSDNGGVYAQGDSIFKLQDSLDDRSVQLFADKINGLFNTYCKAGDVYFAVIPDKSQYAAAGSAHLTMPYAQKLSAVLKKLDPAIEPIDLFDSLCLEDYYRTDLHWRQERLSGVLGKLSAHLGAPFSLEGVEEHVYSPFYGGYLGQIGLPIPPDTLVYLTSELIDSARVDDVQHPDFHQVYATHRLSEMDSYDVYLSGATPIVTLKVESSSPRRLVIFRDSYASSLAPLLLTGYQDITLVDLRYISSDLIGDYVEFEDADVLFLYGEQMLCTPLLLK